MSNLFEIRRAYVNGVANYLNTCRVPRSDLALRVEQYVANDWRAVEDSFAAREPRNTGNASDFTCGFICKMVAGRL